MHTKIIVCHVTRPVALITSVRLEGRYNTAMESQIKTLETHGYNVLYHEISSPAELLRCAYQTSRYGPLPIWNIRGTGHANRIYCNDHGEEHAVLDTTDITSSWIYQRIIEYALPERLKDTIIILQSCRAGAGKKKDVASLANTFGRLFPYSTIYAPQDRISGLNLIMNKAHQIKNVEFYISRGTDQKVPGYRIPRK